MAVALTRIAPRVINGKDDDVAHWDPFLVGKTMLTEVYMEGQCAPLRMGSLAHQSVCAVMEGPLSLVLWQGKSPRKASRGTGLTRDYA